LEKDELIKLAQGLHQEAFAANAYFTIMQQYKENRTEYSQEMQLSPAFYSIIYQALQKACFMEIAKLYDKTQRVVNVGSLIQSCKENLSLFPEYRQNIEYEEDGRKYTFQIPYQHHLKPTEECFFKEKVQSQREVLRIFDVPSADTIPIQVDLTFQELLELYQKRFRSLSKMQENIRMQRNKIYAHNDKESLLDEDIVTKNNPVFYKDIQELIDFALDITQMILGILTNKIQARKYSNVDDWTGTLMLARLGLKYQEYDREQREKAIRSKLNEKFQ
jgi:hypothetical protein